MTLVSSLYVPCLRIHVASTCLKSSLQPASPFEMAVTVTENGGDSKQAFCLDASSRPVLFDSELWVCACIVYEVR